MIRQGRSPPVGVSSPKPARVLLLSPAGRGGRVEPARRLWSGELRLPAHLYNGKVIMDLLEEIAERGWDDHRAQEFERRYGEAIRWRIVINMEKMRLIQQRINPECIDLLTDRRLELFQDTHSDLWIKFLNGLIPRYVQKKKKGKIWQDFLPYVSGVIKHILVENARELKLLGEETPYELLQGICEAQRERKARIAWAKYCLWDRVRDEILNRCDDKFQFQKVYNNIHHVLDYFFEVFVPKRHSLLKRAKRRPVTVLVEALIEEELEEALDYIGKVTPFAMVREVEPPEEVEDEDAFLSSLTQEV